MINCIYHAYKDFRVVDDDLYHQMLESGEWFATPSLAKTERERLENEDGKRQLQQQVQIRENIESETDVGGDGIRQASAKHRRVRSRNSKRVGVGS